MPPIQSQTVAAPTPKPNPLVELLTSEGARLKAAFGDALQSSGFQGSVDALEAVIVNTVASILGGAIPGAQFVTGPASEALVKFAQDATNKGLTALGQDLHPSQVQAPAAPAPAAAPSAPVPSGPISKETLLQKLMEMLK